MYFEVYDGFSEYIPCRVNTAFFFSFKITTCIFKDILKSSLAVMPIPSCVVKHCLSVCRKHKVLG